MAGPVADWLQLVSRALRATRFYPPASATRVQQMEAATQALPRLFGAETSFSLRVKEDRLLLAKKPVLVDEDRVSGLPYLLFSHSIFEVSFAQGVTAKELTDFLEAVVSDFTSEELDGEDLATLLWRLELPHIRYQHVDVLSAAFQARGDDLGSVEDPEVRRLRLELEAMIEALATNRADGSDFRVAFDRGLEAPETAKAAEDWEENNLAYVTGLFENSLPSGALQGFRGEVLAHEKPEAVSLRLLEHLLADSDANFPALAKLVEGVLKAHDFESSLRIMERLGQSVEGGRSGEAVHLLLDRLGSEEQIGHAVEALVRTDRESERARILTYLRMVGTRAARALLSALDQVESNPLLDALADVVSDSVAQRPELIELLGALSGRAALAMLRATAPLPLAPRSAVIWAASSHPEPEVRLAVLELLKGFGPGNADAIVVNALKDTSPLVRERALFMCGERRVTAALPTLSRMVRSREQDESASETLGPLLKAYARVGGAKVASDLLRILNQPPKLTDLRRSAQLQSDAALALAAIDDEAVREHLHKGAKSLNPTLRKACKDALASVSRFGMTGPVVSLPPLGPRIETELPTGIAAPARSSAPPPPLSVPPPPAPPAGLRSSSAPLAPPRSAPPSPPTGAPPPSRLTPEVVDDLFRFLEEDESS